MAPDQPTSPASCHHSNSSSRQPSSTPTSALLPSLLRRQNQSSVASTSASSFVVGSRDALVGAKDGGDDVNGRALRRGATGSTLSLVDSVKGSTLGNTMMSTDTSTSFLHPSSSFVLSRSRSSSSATLRSVTPISSSKGKAKALDQSNPSSSSISDDDNEDEDEFSSDFESLLSRVSSTPRKVRRKKIKSTQNDDDDGIGGSDDEILVEAVATRDGIDARELLREQLRRSGSKSRVRGVGETDAGDGRRESTAKDGSGIGSLEGNASTSLEELPTSPATHSARRYFILSTAGKLIFTTDENEEEATVYVGIMSAIISLFADEGGDKIRYVDAGTVKIAFLLKAPVYFVVVSDWGEPEFLLRMHLEYLYLQILSVVTHSQLHAIFTKRSNFDLRRLLEGTEHFFGHLVAELQTSVPILMNSLEVYRTTSVVREECAKVLSPASKVPDLLYALLLSPSSSTTNSSSTSPTTNKLITLLRPKSHSIHPSDLHLLLSTISSSHSFREAGAENWFPICLPRFNKNGFLHCWIIFTSSSSTTELQGGESVDGKAEIEAGVGVVLVGGDIDGFEQMRSCGKLIMKGLESRNLIKRIAKSRPLQNYSLAELAIPGLRHFIYKSKTSVQVTFPAYEGDYLEEKYRNGLLTLYQKLHEGLHTSSVASGSKPPSKLIYYRTDHEAVLGWTTASFEVYLALSPLLPKTAVISAARAVTKWVKQEEGNLFLTTAPSF